MRAGDAPLQPQALRLRGQGLDVARQRVVAFVAVHVHHQPALGGDGAQHAHRLGTLLRGALEMRDAADHVHPEVERALEVGQRARRPQQAVLREGDELQVQVGLDPLAHVQQRLHRQQAVVAHVHVGADRQQALGHRPVAIRQRALDQGLLRQLRLELAPQRDAFQQRAALVHARQAVAERGVHVEMRVDEGRGDELAGAIDFVSGLRRQMRLQRGDAAMRDADVDPGPTVGQGGVAKNEVQHRAFLRGCCRRLVGACFQPRLEVLRPSRKRGAGRAAVSAAGAGAG